MFLQPHEVLLQWTVTVFDLTQSIKTFAGGVAHFDTDFCLTGLQSPYLFEDHCTCINTIVGLRHKAIPNKQHTMVNTQDNCMYLVSCFTTLRSSTMIATTANTAATTRTIAPNVVIASLTLLVSIPEVPGSNLGPKIGYPDWGVSWVSSVCPRECQDSTLKLGHECFHKNPFQFVTYHPIIRCCIVWVTGKVSQNKLQMYKN
jgi:hypothetical protein